MSFSDMQKYGKTERELEEEEEKNINLEVKSVRRQCNTGKKKQTSNQNTLRFPKKQETALLLEEAFFC